MECFICMEEKSKYVQYCINKHNDEKMCEECFEKMYQCPLCRVVRIKKEIKQESKQIYIVKITKYRGWFDEIRIRITHKKNLDIEQIKNTILNNYNGDYMDLYLKMRNRQYGEYVYKVHKNNWQNEMYIRVLL